MKLLKIIYDAVGVVVTAAISLFIVYEFIINDKQPTNFLIYISLLLYMQIFLKQK